MAEESSWQFLFFCWGNCSVYSKSWKNQVFSANQGLPSAARSNGTELWNGYGYRHACIKNGTCHACINFM